MHHLKLLALAGLIATAAPMVALAQPGQSAVAFRAKLNVNPASPAEVAAVCDAYLQRAAADRVALEARTGPATVAGDLRAYDTMAVTLNSARFDAAIVANTNPDEAKRNAARACQAKVQEALTGLGLSLPIYTRLKGIDTSKLAPELRHPLSRVIQEYERNGVAGGPEAAAKVVALQKRINIASINFARGIADGRKTVTATPAELEGLPADYLASHKPGADGLIKITTDTPDLQPVMAYARNEDLRQRLYLAIMTRAPANAAVLSEMFTARAELATLLGRPSFAALVLEDKMTGSPARAQAFLDELAAISDAPAKAEYDRLLARYRTLSPDSTALPPWSQGYVSQLIRKEAYEVDPQEVRRYFAYNRVRDGIFTLTQDLFGVSIRPWKTDVWHPSVEAFEVVEKGQVIGRFYLDNHPRPGKYTHAQVTPIRLGAKGQELPVAAMIANFPAGGHDTGLMEHQSVETFLHEFGHLLHAMFAGQGDWAMQSMFRLEWDFIEAPSQMLENWVWDYDTLKTFAVDADGKAIPADLVARMNKARSFTRSMRARDQLGFASASLTFHNGPPPADVSAAYRTAYNRYAAIPMVEGTHMYTAWTHMDGYSAYYYTYLWSEMIAKDLATRFETAGLRDKATAAQYRQSVLSQGSKKPAATLVEDFLGRPMNLDAYRRSLAPAS